MRRKLSSSADEDTDGNTANHSQPSHDERKKTFSTAKYDLTRHSDTLDRRKVEKALGPVQLTPDTCRPPTKSSHLPKKSESLPAGQTEDKMLDARARRTLRLRSPWSCSFLTVAATLSALILMLYILHSFTASQLDSKGCDMYYTRSMFYHFADFDTEHTRFASKYSLHLYREIGFDEDPKVSAAFVSREVATHETDGSRSKGFLCFSFQATLAAIDKRDPWLRKLFNIITITSSKTERH